MLLREGIDPQNALPYVDQDTGSGVERRYLGLLPTPPDHPMLAAVPLFSSYLESLGAAVIPSSEWKRHEFERKRHRVPILDQDGHGACVAYASTAGAMLERDRTGAPFQLLGADFLYTLINRGVDAGANAGDAVQALRETGICLASDYSGRPIRPRGVNAQCLKQAARFRLAEAYRIETLEEAVTAAIMGFSYTIAVQAGARYETSTDGTLAYLGRGLNHLQVITAEGLRIVGGKPQLLGRNSWAESWGQGGFAWFQDRHVTSSDEIWVFRCMAQDPQDVVPVVK